MSTPQYQLAANGEAVIRLEDGAHIPFAEGNRDYAQYQEWVAAGNSPLPAEQKPEPTYAELRAAAYPAIGDQLDALWKGGDAAAEMLAKIQAVKAQYPKP
jgi:hypothetical protein